jgi:transcription elongation factor Elf1
MGEKFYCKYCGTSASSIASLTNNSCHRHPSGAGKGKHVLYEGSEKSQYTCKFCGTKASSIASLTNNSCSRHPSGPSKGKHEPAL